MFDNLSGHPTKKDETFQQLFQVHKDRVTGAPPLDVTMGPDALQKEFDEAIQNPGDDWTKYNHCADIIDKNTFMDNQKNIDALLGLEADLNERLGAQ